jgi:uncharacterized membrane protein
MASGAATAEQRGLTGEAPFRGTGREMAAALLERWGLVALYTFTVMAVVGYGVFALNPARLALLPPWASAFYAQSFTFFSQGHVWLAMLILAGVLTLRVGARWLLTFGLAYGISLASELAGTTWGLPFGEYAYTPLLGPMWLDRVPWVIPMSWYFMALPSYALSVLAVRGAGARIAVGSFILLAWDLALDPAMSYATPYWLWGETGPYYGMPWMNLLGWYVTGVVLMGVFVGLRAEQWTGRIAPRWWGAFYGANLLLPLGMCLVAGLWLAVAATLVVLGATWAVLARTGAGRQVTG